MKSRKPVVGQIVHYVMQNGFRPGAHRPAIVLHNEEGKLHLSVFLAPEDQVPAVNLAGFAKIAWETFVWHDTSFKNGTWHYASENETPGPLFEKKGDA